MALNLIIGNKNYSSWSLRPWIAMKVAGIPFAERVISLDDPHFKRTVMAISPAGKVPALADGEVHVWESLAILEYLADKFPDAKLWPDDPEARAHARAIAAEMHAGFVPLRRECPMNFWRPVSAQFEPGCRRERRAHRRDVDRLPRPVRRRRSVPVRPVRGGGRHVRTGGGALYDLRGRCGVGLAGLYGSHDGARRLAGMEGGGGARALGASGG